MILNSSKVRRERRYKTTPVSDHQLRHFGLRQCNAELIQQIKKLHAKQISSRKRQNHIHAPASVISLLSRISGPVVVV